MSKKVDDEPWKLPSIPCPSCDELKIVYEGNYWCTSCDWALPERHEKPLSRELLYWYSLAYMIVMDVMGNKPDLTAVDRIMKGKA